MKWWQRRSTRSEETFTFELLAEHGLPGFYVLERTRDLMALHFDVYNPGCNRFLKSVFYAQFTAGLPGRRRPETIRKVLEYLHDKGEIFSGFTTRYVYLHWPELPELADRYTMKTLTERHKEGKAPPADTGTLRVFVTHYVKEHRNNLDKYEKTILENKELKGKFVRT